MIEQIQKDVARIGITRLCHFTPARSLSHILAGGRGILPSRLLKEEDRLLYNPTDIKRLDGHTDHICCSIEYPNAWYLDRARREEKLFPDWVVLFLNPEALWDETTLFCPRNAAAGSGAHITGGYDGFASMFDRSVPGAKGVTRFRTLLQLPCSPTDDQAEVLVAGSIPRDKILSIGAPSLEQAALERLRLEILDIETSGLTFVAAPDLFDKARLSSMIRAGRRPLEVVLA